MKLPRIAVVGLLIAGIEVSLVQASPSTTASSAQSPPRMVSPVASKFGLTTRNADGTFTARLSSMPANYLADDGRWHPVNSRPTTSSSTRYAVVSQTNGLTSRLPRDPSAEPVKLVAGDTWVTMRMHGVGSARVTAADAGTVEAQARGGRDRVIYELVNTGIKETIRLSRPPQRTVRYVYTLAASPGLTPRLTPEGSVVFGSRRNPEAFTIPPGIMVDSGKDPADDGSVDYTLARKDKGKGWRLTVTPDMAWLLDPSRVYPVLVDPSLSTGPSRDCWLNQSAPTTPYCGDPSTYIRVGKGDSGNTSRRRGLLDFDVSAIPANAIVSSATAWLYLDSTQTPTTASADYGVYAPGKAWKAATWNDSGLAGSWTGGNPGSTTYSTLTLNGQSSGYKSFNGLGAVVQAWVNGSGPRRGLLLKQTGENVVNTMYFFSSSASATNNGKRPYLEVTYSLPPAPADVFNGSEGSRTDITPAVVFDSKVNGQVTPGSTRVAPVVVPAVATEDIDRLVAVVQVLDWTGSGTVSVYGADGEAPATPTVSFAASETVGKVKAVTLELEPSLAANPGSIAIQVTGSGNPRIVVLARAWYGWAQEVLADDAIPPEVLPNDPDYAEMLPGDIPSDEDPELYVRNDKGQAEGLIEPDPSAQDECITTQPEGEPAPSCGVPFSLAGDPNEDAPDTEQGMGQVVELHCSKEGPPWKLKSRTFTCRKSGIGWTIGGAPVIFKITETIATNARDRSVAHRWQVRLKRNDTTVDAFHVTVTAVCSRGCSRVDNASATDIFSSSDPVLADPHTANATGDISSRTSPFDQGHTVAVSTFLRVKLEWLIVFSAKQRLRPSPYIRCDNIKYINAGYGCVLPAYRPTLELYPNGAGPIAPDGTGQSAALIRRAQNLMTGNPGDPDASSKYALSRLISASDRRRNRRMARRICQQSTQPGGTSCDEYPFASTYQGCATTTVTTSPVCVADWVNAAHNSKAGSLLGAFVQRERILDVAAHTKWDRYYVRVH